MLKMIIAFMALLVAGVSVSLAQEKAEPTIDVWSKIAPAADNGVFEKVLQYRKSGDFERAVAVAIEPLNGRQPDDFLLQATADTYFQRAQADQPNREHWVILAVEYSERALQKNPKDLVNAFNVGESYMAAGMNLPKPMGCDYYEKSLQVFEPLESDPALEGEWGTIEGARVFLEPYRHKLRQHIENLRLLAVKCPGFAKTR